ncbi:MAG: hypothetical protein MJZ21_00195 [archaeon]|nr:hypothetical protein [archaeon]
MCPAEDMQPRYTLARNGEWEKTSVKIVTALDQFSAILKKSKISSRCRLANCDGYFPVIKCLDPPQIVYPFVMEILNEKKISAPKLHDLIVEALTEAYPTETADRPTYTGISFDFEDEGIVSKVDLAIVYYDGTKTRFLRHDAKKNKFVFKEEEYSAFDLSEMNVLKKYYKETTKQRIIGEFGRLLCESGELVDDTLACYDEAFRNIINGMLNDPNFDPNKLAYSDDPEDMNQGPVY